MGGEPVEDPVKVLNRPIFQYAYFVNDIDTACMKWINLFGAGPFFRVFHHTVHNDTRGHFSYRGDSAESDVSYAFAYCGPVQIQLIQQHDDKPSIYTEMYKKGEEGFHHVGILSAEFERDRDDFKAQGLDRLYCRDPWRQRGHPWRLQTVERRARYLGRRYGPAEIGVGSARRARAPIIPPQK
jgi:hypothetical protein